jgi:hypothetical protein
LARARGRTAIGWHGISVLVPGDWALGAVGGDRRSGYVRVDDQLMPRLQVKWSQGHINLARKRDEYLKRLTGGKRKRRAGVEVEAEVRVISHRAKPKKELAGFAWRGQQCGMGVFWNCEVCNRAVMAQAMWRPEEAFHEQAREVLGSLEDHGREGWQMWGLDGLAFWAPEGYELGKWKRLTGYLELRLGKGGPRLKVARWGLVSRLLGGRSVREWLEGENAGPPWGGGGAAAHPRGGGGEAGDGGGVRGAGLAL